MSQNNTSAPWFNYRAVQWAMSLPARSALHKLVLVSLASFANTNGRCFPSQRTIAERTMICVRKVRSVLADLEADGVISREPKRGRGRQRIGVDLIVCNFSQAAPHAACQAAPHAAEYNDSLKTEGFRKKTLGTEGIRDPRGQNATFGPRRLH